MDAQMQSTSKSANSYQTWDYYVDSSGNVPILTGSQEEAQAANMAAFLQRGTIPQLPEEGVQWVEYFMGEVTFGDIDNQIKNNLMKIDLVDYFPTYEIVNDALVTNIGVSQ
jgi:hypothetical protein